MPPNARKYLHQHQGAADSLNLMRAQLDPKKSYDIAKMPKLFLYVNWPTVAMCSCLSVDATLIDCNLFTLQMMPRKLLPEPHGQMAVPSANDF